MKKILLFLPVLFFALGFVACSDDDKDMRIEMARPVIDEKKVVIELSTVTFVWDEVDKTGGYAYALDASDDYTFVDASTTSVTISGISTGSHVFKIYAVGVDGKGFDSAITEYEFSTNSTLATPTVSYTVNSASATTSDVVVTWNKVDGAKGYAYKVRDTQTWTEVGSDVLSITLADVPNGDNFSFAMKALGNPPVSEDSKEATMTINLETADGLWIIFTMDEEPASPVQMVETGVGTGIYTATVNCLASDAFYINVENVKYGFMSYSGNGGVGTVNNTMAAVPFYNGGAYYVRESIGLMNTGTSINNFYANVGSACKVFVQVDMNEILDIDGKPLPPSYYLKLVDETSDASVVLAQYFDLAAYGGSWHANTKGSSYNVTSTPAAQTGLTPGTKNGATYTTFGLAWTGLTETFIKNRGMTGWTFENVYEFPGYIRLSNTSTSPLYGVLTTPKLGAAGNLEAKFDGLLFAAFRDTGSKAYMEVKVLNGGKIAAVNVVKDGVGSAVTIQPAGDDSFHINGSYHTDFANADQKTFSNFTFTIEGATADTQIMWNCKTNNTIASSQYRYCIDNIVVKKK